MTNADLELAATLYREHVKKHGSQQQEEKLIDDWDKEAEDDRRAKRQKSNAAKEKTLEIAKATTVVIDAAAIQKYKKDECRAQLQAWSVWLTEQGFKIGSKVGQVDCLLTGKVQELRDKLKSLASLYGTKISADRALSGGDVVANTQALLVQGTVPHTMGVGANINDYESDDEEDRMGRITASQKWVEFDDDCNVASSGTFNGKA